MVLLKGNLYSGKVGDHIYKVRDGKQYVSTVPAKVSQPRTPLQMSQRSRMPNILAMYRAMKPFAAECFETAGGGNAYNRFISVNLRKPEVFITKAVSNRQGGVVAPYWVSQGSLDPISVTGRGSGAKSSIALGGLEIGAQTTVREFATAVCTLNPKVEHGDRLAFLLFEQRQDSVSGMPLIRARFWQVELDVSDETPLWKTVDSVGFTSRDGVLSVSGADLGNCGLCWMHSRQVSRSKRLVSSQRLVDDNALLADYMSDDAKLASMISYGMKPEAFITAAESNG